MPRAIASNDAEAAWIQLATRVPRVVHRAVKLACVHADVTVQVFVVAALREKLARDSGRRRQRGSCRRRPVALA